MDAFPAFFPLAGRKVVVAGPGEAAEAKARLFEGSPAQVVRIPGVEALSSSAYDGALLAFIASDDAAYCEAAARAARAAGALVNVADRPALCDFTTPAVIDRGEVVAAVGTGGAAPALAALLRGDIEARVPAGAGRVAALMRLMQDEVRRTLPDPARRRAFLRAAMEGPAAASAMAGDMDEGERLLRAALAEAGSRAPGRIVFIAGRGPADLLSLRAARALSQADVLVADGGVDPAVLSLARRDARREEAADAEALAALAAEGLTVVRLLAAPVAPDLIRALAAGGVTVEALAQAPA